MTYGNCLWEEMSFLDRASNFLVEDVSSPHGSPLERGNIRN